MILPANQSGSRFKRLEIQMNQFKKIYSIVLASIFIALSFSSPKVFAQSKLELSATLDSETYKMKAEFILKVTLKNTGQTPLVIYKKMRWSAFSSLFLETMDSKGELLSPSLISELKDLPPFSEQDFLTLKPNETFTLKSSFSRWSLGVKDPGDYQLFVLYECPVRREVVPKGLLNVWTKENGRLTSKPVAISFVE
jgi:hypothetical protein